MVQLLQQTSAACPTGIDLATCTGIPPPTPHAHVTPTPSTPYVLSRVSDMVNNPYPLACALYMSSPSLPSIDSVCASTPPPSSPLPLLPSLLPGVRVAGVPVVLLRKEAVYNAVGVAAYELHDYVDWDPWLRGALLQVRGRRQGGRGLVV